MESRDGVEHWLKPPAVKLHKPLLAEERVLTVPSPRCHTVLFFYTCLKVNCIVSPERIRSGNSSPLRPGGEPVGNSGCHKFQLLTHDFLPKNGIGLSFKLSSRRYKSWFKVLKASSFQVSSNTRPNQVTSLHKQKRKDTEILHFKELSTALRGFRVNM